MTTQLDDQWLQLSWSTLSRIEAMLDDDNNNNNTNDNRSGTHPFRHNDFLKDIILKVGWRNNRGVRVTDLSMAIRI